MAEESKGGEPMGGQQQQQTPAKRQAPRAEENEDGDSDEVGQVVVSL